MRLLGISGSLMRSGRTRSAVQLAVNSAHRASAEIEVELIDLRDWKISLPDGRPLAEYPDNTLHVVQIIQRVDCFIIWKPDISWNI